MATASKTNKTSWKAANTQVDPEKGPKWDEEMQALIVEQVKAADKAGLRRKDVFEGLAEQFSNEYVHDYTPNQVSSQFHLVKTRFGYVVDAQVQGGSHTGSRRKIVRPPNLTLTRARLGSMDLEQENVTLRENLAELREARNADHVSLLEARRELARVNGMLNKARKRESALREERASLKTQLNEVKSRLARMAELAS